MALTAATCLASLVVWRPGGCLVGSPLAAAGAAPGNPCEALSTELHEQMRPRIARWEKTAFEGRTIPGYGGQASRLLNRTLAAFDLKVEERQLVNVSGGCAAERAGLEKAVTKQLHSIFLVQRSAIEQVLYQRLKKDLLRRMQRKHRELNVKEKLRLLHASMKEYDSQVHELIPSFVDNPERDRAEKRLSELQWGVHLLPEAKEMQQRWKMERLRRMPMRQSKGGSISLSPGLRLMFRPGGFGNFQIYSRRQVGPPHNPNEVAIGVLNDGHVVDVYNKRPNPPLIKFQPTIAFDMSVG